MKPGKILAAASASALGMFAWSSSAMAQDVAGASAARPDSEAHLEEVTVTAQKRAENLQNVPIAVAALSEDALGKLAVDQIQYLSTAVPSLNVANTYGRLSMSLRGIGTTNVGPGAENPTALYIDGVYYAASAASLLSLNNIAQVEILKGPQGTLFGRNATAGLVQITTRTPTQDLSGTVDLTYGNYDTVAGNAYLSGGLSDALAADFAVYVRHQGEGWGRNLTTGHDIYDVDHDLSARSKWVMTPAANTRLTLILDYEDVENGMLGSTLNPGTQSPFAPGLQPDLGYDSTADFDPHYTLEAGGASLRWDQEIGALNFASITAYRESKTLYGTDIDGIALDRAWFLWKQDDTQFTQELQLSSDSAQRLKWTAGAFFYTGESGLNPALLGLRFLGIRFDYPRTNMHIGSIAGYMQGTYALTDATNITLGGRYTHEKHNTYDTRTAVFGIDANPATAFITEIAPDRQVDHKFTYRASIDHRFSSELMAYASVNRGFKAGGFNNAAPGSPRYEPETLDAYEIGIKTDLLNRRLRFNLAGFYNDYQNIQVQQYRFTITTVNGARARSYGADADLTFVLTEGLTLNAGATLISPKFTEFDGCGTPGPLGGVLLTAGDCSGNQLPIASKAVFNVAADYRLDMGSSTLDFNVNAYSNSGYFTDVANAIHQKRFEKIGTFARWTFGNQLSVGVYGRNLTNSRVITYGDSQQVGTQNVSYDEPRTFGATLGYEF